MQNVNVNVVNLAVINEFVINRNRFVLHKSHAAYASQEKRVDSVNEADQEIDRQREEERETEAVAGQLMCVLVCVCAHN